MSPARSDSSRQAGSIATTAKCRPASDRETFRHYFAYQINRLCSRAVLNASHVRSCDDFRRLERGGCWSVPLFPHRRSHRSLRDCRARSSRSPRRRFPAIAPITTSDGGCVPRSRKGTGQALNASITRHRRSPSLRDPIYWGNSWLKRINDADLTKLEWVL
jgi:hypothetical protein